MDADMRQIVFLNCPVFSKHYYSLSEEHSTFVFNIELLEIFLSIGSRSRTTAAPGNRWSVRLRTTRLRPLVLEGEMKPSELKVSRLTCKGKSFDIGPKDKKNRHPAELERAREFARAAGFEAVGEPRRKPKHFEVLGRRAGKLFELHVELNGQIRKAKPVTDDSKWAETTRPK
jgi:hypothetical protein